MARLFNDAASESLRVDAAVVGGEPFTMAAWIYKDDDANSSAVMSVADKDVADQQHRMIYDSLEDVVASTFDGTIANARSTGVGGNNEWTHCCAVFAASNDRRAYRDGGNEGTNADARTVAGIDRLTIGVTADSTPLDNASGRIAEAAIWDVALTVAEIAALARGVSPLRIRRGNLKGYWPLLAKTGDAPDYSGNGNTLTDINTVSIADHAPVAPPFGFDLGWMGAFTAAGAVTLTPTPVGVTATIPVPTIQVGAVIVAPIPVVGTLTTPTPAVQVGPISTTPTPVVGVLTATTPTVSAGTFITPVPTVASAIATSPTLQVGGVVIAPVPVVGVLSVVSPTIQIGGIVAIPTPVVGIASTTVPAVQVGGVSVTPSPLVTALTASIPVVQVGPVTILPTSISALLTTTVPLAYSGTTVLSTPVVANLTVTTPVVQVGSVIIVPTSVAVILGVAVPSIVIPVPVDLTVAITPTKLNALTITSTKLNSVEVTSVPK